MHLALQESILVCFKLCFLFDCCFNGPKKKTSIITNRWMVFCHAPMTNLQTEQAHNTQRSNIRINKVQSVQIQSTTMQFSQYFLIEKQQKKKKTKKKHACQG